MNYELAKELKEAGFPQKGLGRWVDDTNGIWSDRPDYDSKFAFAYFPSLEELIEACGEAFNDLQRPTSDTAERKWYALATAPTKPWPHGEGETPTEAVARLWLALNATNSNQSEPSRTNSLSTEQF